MIWTATIVGVVALIGFLLWLRSRKPSTFRAVFVDEVPESLRKHSIYIAGESGHYWSASLLCPCGCGDLIQLNLLQQVRPCWQIKSHQDGSVSIMPSVWRRQGCKSHFFVREGRIDWC